MNIERSIQISAPVERIFDLLTDSSNLLHIAPTVQFGTDQPNGRVEVTTERNGEIRRATGFFHPDRESWSARWGLDEGSYQGRFSLRPEQDGARLTVSLSGLSNTDGDPLGEALERVKSLAEKHDSPEELQAVASRLQGNY